MVCGRGGLYWWYTRPADGTSGAGCLSIFLVWFGLVFESRTLHLRPPRRFVGFFSSFSGRVQNVYVSVLPAGTYYYTGSWQ